MGITAVVCMVFGAVFFSILEIAGFPRAYEETSVDRLRRFLGSKQAPKESVLLADGMAPSLKRLQGKLHRLGLYHNRDFEIAIHVRRICYVIPLVPTAVCFFLGFPLPQIFLLGALLGLIFILIPRVLLLHMAMKRKFEIERSLPDALDFLIICLEAGLSFHASLVRVAKEQRQVSADLAHELELTNQEIMAGKSQHEALKNLAARANSEVVRGLVSTIQQSVKLGTSLVKALRTQAGALRKEKRQKIHEAILKTPVKLIFPLMFFIFPTLLIVVLAPSLISIFRNLSAVGY